MEWGPKQTKYIFLSLFVLAVLVSIVNLILTTINFHLHLSFRCKHRLPESFIYLIGTFFVTAVGVLWFRLLRDKGTRAHGILHSVAFALMLMGHWHVFDLLMKGEVKRCYNQYFLSLLTMFVYLTQYILAFHFVVFRKGKTPDEVAFRTGIHSFGGVITFILCSFDGFLMCIKLSFFGHFINPILDIFPYVPATFLFVVLLLWFLILNPYFDWRRMRSLMSSRPSEASVCPKTSRLKRRTSSKTLCKAPSNANECRPSNCPPPTCKS